jgi:hypothetical protein
VWHELALLPTQLGRYLGTLPQPAKRYLGLLYQWHLGMEVDLADVLPHVGPAIRHAADPRLAFQEREMGTREHLHHPLLRHVWALEDMVEERVASALSPAVDPASDEPLES